MYLMQVSIIFLLNNSVLSYYYQPHGYYDYQFYQDYQKPSSRSDRSLENYGYNSANVEDQYTYDTKEEYVYPITGIDWFGRKKYSNTNHNFQYPSDQESESVIEIQKRFDHRMGSYNVQTGDEFFLNGFDVRPKFKTKENDKDIFEFEYYGYTTQATPIQYANSLPPTAAYNGNRKVGLNRKTTRRPNTKTVRKPTVHYNTNRNKNKQTGNKRRPNVSTTRRPTRNKNQTKRKPVVINKQTNRKPTKKVQNNCNNSMKLPTKIPTRNSNKKKPMIMNQKRPNQANKFNRKKKLSTNTKKTTRPNSSFDQTFPTPQTLVINNVIRRYIDKLQAKSQNRKNGQSVVNRDSFTRKMFNMPTFEDIKNSTMSLTNKFLSLFTVVQFENFQCVANSDTGQYIGTCYHENQCEKMGGFSAGDCANGYGVCCVFQRTCGESSSQNLTYFESINYPNYFPYQNLNVTYTQINSQQDEEQVPPNQPTIPNNPPMNQPDIVFDDPMNQPDIPNAIPEDYPDDEINFSIEIDDVDADEASDEDPTEIPETTTDVDDYDTNATNPSESTELPNAVVPVTPHPRYQHNKYHEYKISRQDNMADSLACIFWVYKTSSDIQQMRIDFIDFELIGPNQNGNCLEERFVVSGQNINAPIPVICGYNTGHHFYVDVSSLTGPLQMSILSTSTTNKRYKFLVSQLATPCSNSHNCLQYLTGTSGTISSFNYEDGHRSNPQYMNNLNYAICIRRESGYCSITYETDGNLFEITNMSNGVDDLESPSAGVDQCPDDYLVIDNMRICGGRIQSPITDRSPGPIVIPVRSDAQITGRGFKLNYRQNKCIAMTM